MVMAAFVLLLAQGGELDVRRTLAAGDRDAFAMLPPETVCGAEAVELTWSPDGKTLIVRRAAIAPSPAEVAAALASGNPPPKPKTEIVVWDVASRRARTAFSAPSATVQIDSIQAMPGSDRIVFDLTERIPGANGAEGRTVESVGIVAVGTGALTRITLSDGALGGATISPTRPLGMIHILERNRGSSVRFFGPDGRLGPATSFPDRRNVFFDATGQPAFLASEGTGPMLLQRLDPATGKVVAKVKLPPPTRTKDGTLLASPEETALTRPGFRRLDGPPPLLTLLPANVSTPGAPKISILALQVRGGRPEESGIVSTDGTMPTLSPANDAVAYVDQGSAVVRLLVRVPREAYDRATAEVAKREALDRAKQVGIGLLQFASDHDDVLPTLSENLRQAVGPYLRTDRLLDGFSYTFRGSDIDKIEDISTTELGYVGGPGGRAVVYADGHVKWISDRS